MSHTSTKAWTCKSSSDFSLAYWLKNHYSLVFWLCLLSSAWPAVDLWLGLRNNTLGANPLQSLQQLSGWWALIFLIVTLSITPLRRLLSYIACQRHTRFGKRLSDWNWVIRLRRMLGLYCFAYATLHVLIYTHFELSWQWAWAVKEFSEKTFLQTGLAGFLLLVPLAATSSVRAIRLLGRNWRRLHRSVYLIAVLAVAHQVDAAKILEADQLLTSATLSGLILYRVLCHIGCGFRRPNDDGMEVSARRAGCQNRRRSP